MMEEQIAHLLNASSTDRKKLNELITDYLKHYDSESDNEVEDGDASTEDSNDAEFVNDADVALQLQRASYTCTSSEAPLALSEEEDLQKASQFR